MRCAAVPAPFGSVGLVVGPRGLSRVILTARPAKATPPWLADVFGARHVPDLLAGLQRRLRAYLSGRRVRLSVPKVDLGGLTPFQRAVLDACAEVGYGETATYGELARRIGRANAARAVGAALGRNPLPLVIPCHRVVASDGSLGGFSAEQGVEIKRHLLDMESAGRRACES